MQEDLYMKFSRSNEVEYLPNQKAFVHDVPSSRFYTIALQLSSRNCPSLCYQREPDK